MDKDSNRKRKMKKKYGPPDGKRQKFGRSLQPGMRGFIVTCDRGEKRALEEAYDLLSEYGTDSSPVNSAEALKDEEDVSASIARDCAQLQTPKFQQAASGARNCLFIELKDAALDPVELTHRILNDIQTKGREKCRFIQRLLPVSVCFRATVQELKSHCEKLLLEELRDKSNFSYSVVFKARNNSTLSRADVIDAVADVMKGAYPLSRVNLDAPDWAVLVQVIKTTCCLSVVENYEKFRKYNLQELNLNKAS